MARSSTLPIQHSSSTASTSKSKDKPLHRSNTVVEEPTTPKHHLHIPHPHIPFVHHKDHSPQDHEPLRTSTSTKTRPTGALNRQNSVHTRYINMLLAQDTIPRFHTILAAFFTWVLLAGFLVFPGTFTSLQRLEADEDDEAGQRVLAAVKNIRLVYVGAICCGVGGGGMIWLWIRHRTNFVWVLNRIFLPGCLNSFAGLISTLINVYSQQRGHWSTTAWITAAVTGGVMAITGVLFGLYNFWLLEKVRRKHGREMEAFEGAEDEGLKEKMERKSKEPALEPGSVV